MRCQLKFVLALALFSIQCGGHAEKSNAYKLFHTQPTAYLTGVHNLSTTVELEDFLVTQAAIYIDNVHEVYQKFFYKLLGELPRSKRWHELQHFTILMDDYLNMQYDLNVKLKKYEHFMEHNEGRFATLFEYDASETLLNTTEYNDIYVANQVEEVLTYANAIQMREFVQHTGEGLRLYLILNRPRVNKLQLLEFKTIIDKFLESSEFIFKWRSLKMLLSRLREILT